ncbi:hypothetical protein CsSME_00049749 [Camellia sinensis var. sinensis]
MNTYQIDLRISIPLLVKLASLLASYLCPPSVFRVAYMFCICIWISPCSGVLCSMLNRSLQAMPIPALLITCTTPTTQTHQQQQTTTTPPVLEFHSNDEFVIDIDEGDGENLQVIYGGHA